MKSRNHPLPFVLKRVLRCISLLLLPALAAEVGRANPVTRNLLGKDPIDGPGATSHRGEQVPYLTAVGPIGLRIEDAPSVPDFEVEPIATGPAQLGGDASIAAQQASAIREKPEVIPSAAQGDQKTAPAAADKKGAAPEPEVTPILPDDTRREVRPEDVIPFFQFPRSGAGITTPVPPQPARPPTLPPSSATYNQQ
jgi:hypothetical protein